MKLFLCPVSKKSLYVQLMLRSVRDQYQPVFREEGGLAEAIACLEAGEDVLVHVQWEEFFFRAMPTPEQADAAAELAERQLRRVAALGGAIVWTVHNALPHRIPHVEQFMRIRAVLAHIARRILVHNNASRDFIRQQVDVPDADARIILLPHPSYAGLYEPEGVAEAALRTRPDALSEKFVLGFGSIRKQKGFDAMIDALDPAFTAKHGLRLRISGDGAEGPLLRKAYGDRTDIDWDLAYVPMDDVPALFRAASCVMLPYTRLLTSGVALLSLTVGGIIVAPAMPTFVELLPEPLRRFLYKPDDPADLRRVVADVAGLTPEQDRDYRLLGMESVEAVHPALISATLGAIYRGLAVPKVQAPNSVEVLPNLG